MRRAMQLLIAAVLLVQFTALAPPRPIPQEQNAPANTAVSKYPDTPEGLKGLLDDIFVAVKSNDIANYSSYFADMAIPKDDAWFAQAFGPTEGARLDEKYRALQPQAVNELKKVFDYAIKNGCTNVEVKVYQKAGEQTVGILHAALEAMAGP